MRASSRPAEARPEADVIVWYAVLLAGVVPAVTLGWISSALADRLPFAGWGLVMAVTYAVLLRLGWQRRWRFASLAALLLAVAAGGLAILSLLAGRYGEVLDAGFRSHLPRLYHPSLIAPAAGLSAAALLALAAAALAVQVWRVARRAGRRPS